MRDESPITFREPSSASHLRGRSCASSRSGSRRAKAGRHDGLDDMKSVHPIMAAVLAATLAPRQPSPQHERALWSHWCVAEKSNIFTARGEPCSWCGARERR